MEISFEDFEKINMKVGKVLNVEEIPESKSLLKLQVDFGLEKRQAVAGLKQFYRPEELKNKKFIFVLNLKPRKIMREESNCMILAVENKNKNISLIQPEKDMEEGSLVR
jgi:methionyl-tRNA synthetase